jgi:hypothetical protein
LAFKLGGVEEKSKTSKKTEARTCLQRARASIWGAAELPLASLPIEHSYPRENSLSRKIGGDAEVPNPP